jgi:putative FmdB family regulatory protein
VPAYDYRCRTCDVLFEVRRGLDEAPTPAPCPSGHGETSRVFTPGGGRRRQRLSRQRAGEQRHERWRLLRRRLLRLTSCRPPGVDGIAAGRAACTTVRRPACPQSGHTASTAAAPRRRTGHPALSTGPLDAAREPA